MTKETFDKIDYWDTNECAEELSHLEIYEAVERWADDLYPEKPDEIVTVYGWIRKEIPGNTVGFLQESLLEHAIAYLDDEYGSPYEATDTDSVMVRSAGEFADAVVKNYHVWQCELAGAIEVEVLPGGEIVLPDFDAVEK